MQNNLPIPRSSSSLLLSSMSAGVCFITTSLAVITEATRTLDFNCMVRLQDKIPYRLLPLYELAVELGSMEIMTVTLGLSLLFMPLAKKYKSMVVLFYCVGLAVVVLGKMTIDHPAPPYMFQKNSIGLHFPSTYVQITSSYPSGHTFRTIFVTSFLGLFFLFNKGKKIIKTSSTLVLAGTAFTIPIALVILGKHWPSDVIGGCMLAVSLSLLSWFVIHRDESAHRK